MQYKVLGILAGLVIIGIGFVALSSMSQRKNNSKIRPDNSLSESSITAELLPDVAPKKMTYNSAPKTVIDKNKTYTATMVTSKGTIVLELFSKETPVTVNNFVFLSRENFYNGTKFHRIMKNFMIQGGDPKGDGTGGPGYTFDDEPFTRSYNNGVIAMANRGPNTNGSQFFIVHGDDVELPKQYVIFGQVTKGLEVVDAIANTPVGSNPFGEPSSPKEDVVIESIEIVEQ